MEVQTHRAEELAAQYLAGRRQAMEDLIQEIQDVVYFHCVKLMRNEDDAQDAAQEVLMAVLQGLDGLRNPSSFYSWLNRIIARTCAKLYAREHRENASDEDPVPLPFEEVDDQQIPEKIIDTEETRRMIRELVDGLPPAQRLSILLYYFDELPVKDIAEVMDTPENTVKSRLSYARRAIKTGVDRWIAQGLTFYSFTPLPYLRYFLQKEAEDCRLPPAAAMRVRDALLAAGMAGAAATGSAAGGAAAGAAAAGGTAAGGFVHKGVLLALAGLLAAGSVGGLLLRRPPQQPDILQKPEPPQVVETVPRPAEPETPEYQPDTLSDVPEPPPEVQRLQLPVPPPAEETPGEWDGAFTVLPVPPAEEEPPEEPGTKLSPPPEEEPESDEEESDSDPDEDDDDDDDDDDDGDTDPEPGPVPPVTNDYQPNRNFGNYLGINADGIHEFDVYLTADRESWTVHPVEDAGWYSRLEISDESRVSYRAGYIYGVAPGRSEVRYYLSRSPDGPFELAVIAYVTVAPVKPVTPDYNWGTYEKTAANIAYFRHTLVRGGLEPRTPFQPGSFYVRAVSDDPGTVEANQNAQLRAAGTGTATVRYYTRWTENDPWTEAAVVKVTVLEEKPPEAVVIERQARSVNYGSNESFFDMWQGDLPGALRFTSSNPAVVYVTQESGDFSALSPGTAELTAYEPLRPDQCYVLEVQVADRFAWECAPEDVTLCLGETLEHEVSYTLHTSNGAHVSSISINSADRNIADIVYRPQDELPEDTIRFEMIGRSQGAVEVTGRVAFDVLTYDGFKRMETAFTFQVQVNEPPEDGIPTVRKEAEQFGKCSGYGYSGRFQNFWDEELPEDGVTYLSSDPAVACISEWGSFTTVSAGTVELTATSTEEPARRYALTLHVEDRLDCVRTIEEATGWLEDTTGSASAPNYELSAGGRGLTDIKWTSSDPEILTVIAGSAYSCSFKPLRAGKALLHGAATLMIDTPEGSKSVKDEFSVPVTVDYHRETEAVEAGPFGFCSGYGYTGSLRDYFPDLPDGLTFGSSDLSVACIHKDGRFTTLKPGRVLLYAYTSSDSSSHQYAVWLNVQDAMDWTCSLEDAALDVGGSVLCGVEDARMNPGVSLNSAYWYAADSRIVSVTKDADDPLRCRVEAKQPGTTTVTGLLSVKAPYYLWGNVSSASLSVTVSFPVTVREAEETDSDAPPDAP